MPANQPLILPVTPEQAKDYIALFVNRLTYLRQNHFANPHTGRFNYYQVTEKRDKGDKTPKKPLPLTPKTIELHLGGYITVAHYAIRPGAQTCKWIAIDADYSDARPDLLRLQAAFQKDGIASLMEQSKRGGHLWVFLADPLPARICRLYVVNVAFRLGVPVKRDKEDGIEVFPRQNEIAPDEFGNAIRGPLGVHRASNERYWFEDAPHGLRAQLQLLKEVPKVTLEQLESLTAGMPAIPDPEPLKPWVDMSTLPGVGSAGKEIFEILNYVQVKRGSGKEWVAVCPSCGKKPLNINKETPTLYRCWHGCTKEQIRAAVGAAPPRAFRMGSAA